MIMLCYDSADRMIGRQVVNSEVKSRDVVAVSSALCMRLSESRTFAVLISFLAVIVVIGFH